MLGRAKREVCFIRSSKKGTNMLKNPICMESRSRSIVKSLIYRILSLLGIGILGWLITRDIKETTFITIVFQIYLIILYYVYERVWNKVNWGRRN